MTAYRINQGKLLVLSLGQREALQRKVFISAPDSHGNKQSTPVENIQHDTGDHDRHNRCSHFLTGRPSASLKK
jgi:hypothetical protein